MHVIEYTYTYTLTNMHTHKYKYKHTFVHHTRLNIELYREVHVIQNVG